MASAHSNDSYSANGNIQPRWLMRIVQNVFLSLTSGEGLEGTNLLHEKKKRKFHYIKH